MMELTTELNALFIETAETLKGSDRRISMAQVVKMLGKGGQRRAEKELGWNRGVIRTGTHELESSFRCVDAMSARGRKRAEDHLPHLLEDIIAILDEQSQIDPTFKTTRVFTRISAAEVRSAPGVAVRWLVQGHVAREIIIGRPIGNQIDRAKGVLSGQGHILKIAPLTVGHGDGPQWLPVVCALTKQRV
jgi:hypothetical protein